MEKTVLLCSEELIRLLREAIEDVHASQDTEAIEYLQKRCGKLGVDMLKYLIGRPDLWDKLPSLRKEDGWIRKDYHQ